MVRFISVPSSWAMYKVPDETFQLLVNGAMTQPPQVVLEVMVLNGEAERVGSVETVVMTNDGDEEDGDEEEGLPDTGNPFDEGQP